LGKFEGGGRSPRACFPKLRIEPFEQFEGSRTFTNFIEPLLPKNEPNNPALTAPDPLACVNYNVRTHRDALARHTSMHSIVRFTHKHMIIHSACMFIYAVTHTAHNLHTNTHTPR
jgi:hypothetical protein